MINEETREKLLEKLILHEGMRLKVYDDANGNEVRAGDTLIGHPTIGVGRNIAGDGLGITEKEAKMLLSNDVDRVLKEIDHWSFIKELSEVRKTVIIDMVFNMGVSRFNQNQWPNFFRAVTEGDFKRAKKEMLDSKWAGQVKTRANILANMMESDEWL
tara:strand:+ start:1172 stop:1645 length:474 start_codon:yes stop_codon:yes gene_type:complete